MIRTLSDTKEQLVPDLFLVEPRRGESKIVSQTLKHIEQSKVHGIVRTTERSEGGSIKGDLALGRGGF